MPVVSFSPRPAKDTVRYVLMRLRQHWPKLVSTEETSDGEFEFTYKALALPKCFRVYSEDLVHENYSGAMGLSVVVEDGRIILDAFDRLLGVYHGEPLPADHPAVVAALFLYNDPIWRTDFGTESTG